MYFRIYSFPGFFLCSGYFYCSSGVFWGVCFARSQSAQFCSRVPCCKVECFLSHRKTLNYRKSNRATPLIHLPLLKLLFFKISNIVRTESGVFFVLPWNSVLRGISGTFFLALEERPQETPRKLPGGFQGASGTAFFSGSQKLLEQQFVVSSLEVSFFFDFFSHVLMAELKFSCGNNSLEIYPFFATDFRHTHPTHIFRHVYAPQPSATYTPAIFQRPRQRAGVSGSCVAADRPPKSYPRLLSIMHCCSLSQVSDDFMTTPHYSTAIRTELALCF